MKKMRWTALALALALLFVPVARAEEAIAPFGGTKEWPEFRQMQFGLPATVVGVREESRGVELKVWGLEDALIRDVESGMRDFPFTLWATIPVYGQDATVRYEFSYYRLQRVACLATFATQEEAQAYYDTARADLEALYGAPDTRTVPVLNDSGEYDWLPVDPEDEYYQLFGAQEIPDVTPKLQWNMGVGCRSTGDIANMDAEGVTGTLGLLLTQSEETARENGVALEDGEWLAVVELVDLYVANQTKLEQAKYYDPRMYE